MTRLAGRAVIAVLVLGLSILMPLQASADQIVILDSWNESNIQGSGDIVEVVIGQDNGNTTLTFQWQEADTGDDLWTAIGLDTIFYNSNVLVLLVLDQDGNDVTANWSLNFGGTNSGGGFGTMLSKKNLDSGGTGGIDPDSITLVLDGLATLTPNSDGSTFSAHVRYGQDCSGWVSDGTPNGGTIGTSAACGGTTVPEPGTLALLGIGLFGLGLARRKKI